MKDSAVLALMTYKTKDDRTIEFTFDSIKDKEDFEANLEEFFKMLKEAKEAKEYCPYCLQREKTKYICKQYGKYYRAGDLLTKSEAKDKRESRTYLW